MFFGNLEIDRNDSGYVDASEENNTLIIAIDAQTMRIAPVGDDWVHRPKPITLKLGIGGVHYLRNGLYKIEIFSKAPHRFVRLSSNTGYDF